MRFSIVINTLNRHDSLRTTLGSLKNLNHDDFEVIVVNGPSSDNTAALLEEYVGRIKQASVPVSNLSVSRNVGIQLSSGEVVVFLDDDAVPDPEWLNELAVVYRTRTCSAVGGAVVSRDGVNYQQIYGVCSRLGRHQSYHDLKQRDLVSFNVSNLPSADPFRNLMGANSSFRVEVLRSIGGFDEEIEYYLDESDVCVRLNTLGHSIEFSESAVVHHYFAENALRDGRSRFKSVFPIVKNKVYFAYKHGRGHHDLEVIRQDTVNWVTEWRGRVESSVEDEELKSQLLKEIDEGAAVGAARAEESPKYRTFAESPPPFLPFNEGARTRRDGGRRRLCFLSKGYPPVDTFGIARYTHDIAVGLAERQHEVHVLTQGKEGLCVRFDEGVWIHEIPLQHGSTQTDEAKRPVVSGMLHWTWSAASYLEKLQRRKDFDLVIGPNWDAEPLGILLSNRSRTLVSVQTTAQMMLDLNKDAPACKGLQMAREMEGRMFLLARRIWAISDAIGQHVEQAYALHPECRIHVARLGLKDQSAQVMRSRSELDGKLTVLFSGRLEPRKGIDILLEAIPLLVRSHAGLEFRIIGRDTSDGRYQNQFQNDFPEASEKVSFLGYVDDATLLREYANADIFCAPSRYESFGLVLLESMMFGVATVGCAIGGMKEIVHHEVNGLLAKPGDVTDLVGQLERLINNGEFRRRIALAGRKRYEEEFTLSKAVERFEAMVDAICIDERKV